MSLSVLVVDANVIIDLHIGGLIIETFEMPYHFMTPNVIVEEIHSPKGIALIKLGLESVDLPERLVQEVYRLSFIYRKPSPKDIAALVLAHDLGVVLVTGDRRLAEAAAQEGVHTHGTLWVLDELIQLGIITPDIGADGLDRMRQYGSRFPEYECLKRLSRWRSMEE